MSDILKEEQLSDEKLAAATASFFRQRSELAQEIISNRNGFWERWSLVIFMAILIILGAASWFVKYPDIVEVKAYLHQRYPSQPISCHTSGEVSIVLARNHAVVRIGQPLLLIGDKAKYEQVKILSDKITAFMTGHHNNRVDAGHQYVEDVEQDPEGIDKIIGKYSKMINNKAHPLPSRELLADQKKLLIWLDRHQLKANAAGKVIFVEPINEGDLLTSGAIVAYIEPLINKYFLKTLIPQGQLGKVDSGLTVQLRFDAYPYQEMGFVKGRLTYISDFSSEGGFSAIIMLPNGLRTENAIDLQFRSGLTAHAVIVTKDMRLIHRIYFSTVKSISTD